MTKPFDTTEQFLKAFDLEAYKNYYDPIPLRDSKVGFSIKRKYPEDIRYKPAFKKDGSPDNIVAIWVVYSHPQETKKEININKVPIRVRVANMSLYRTAHFDYDFNDENCPTEDSAEKSASTPKPIELDYSNEFFYDHERDEFINEVGTVIKGIDILNRVFTDHCDTVHWLKSLKLRSKLFAQAKGTGLLSALITFLVFALKKTFGRTLEEKDTFSAIYHGYKKDDFKKLNEDSLNVLGYKAAKSVIIVFCFIVIVTTFWRYKANMSGGYLGHIASNNTLSLIHGLFFIWFLDVVVPYLLFWLINGIIKIRTNIMFMRFKVP